MSRRRSRLPSTAIASSSAQILSVDEFLKGLHRTPRRSRNKPTQINTSSATTKTIPLPEGNQEDGFLLETLAALEKADEETARSITKGELKKSVMLGTKLPKKRRKKHHVAYNSLVLSRDPQNERFLYLGEAQEDSDPDPILGSITQTDNPVPILLKPRFPVSVIRGSIVSPWSRRGKNLAAAAGEEGSGVIPHERENWGDRIDSLLVPGGAGAGTIRGWAPSLKGALELVNVADRAESPTGANKFPHFVSFDSQFATSDCSPSQDQGLVGVELGPELGFFQPPRVNTGSEKPIQPISQHFKRICAINSTKLSEQTNEVTGEGHTAEPPFGSGASEFGPDNRDQAKAQGSATGEIFPGVSPSLIGSDITVEKGVQGGSMANTPGYPWEKFDRGPTPFPSPEPGIVPQGSDCSSLLRFWESQLSKSSPNFSIPGDGTGASISPMQEPEGSPQFRAEGGTKKPPLTLEGELGEGNPISSSAQLWEDYQLGHLEPTPPPNQPLRVILESPKSIPRSDQPVQGQMGQAMLPPPLRQPRNLIDGDECEDDMDYINEISRRDYFSSAQKILNDCEDPRPEVSPTRSNWTIDTISTEVQLGSENVHRAQPPTYSLCPLSAPAPARTYSSIPLRDIIRRRETVPLRRPTISASFKSPFLSKSPMENVDRALIPATSEFIRRGQEDGTVSIANPAPFILPASIVPSASVAQSESRAKRRVTKSQSFSLSTSSCAPGIGLRRTTQAALLRPHRGMTIRFEPSQKPFKPPLATKPLRPTPRTSRYPSGFGTTDGSPPLVNPRGKVITETGVKSGQRAVGEGAQCAGVSKVATSSFAEVQAAW